MKLIRAFTHVALMALMSMVFIGTTSAMAESTALCTVDESPCEEKNQVTYIHEVSVGNATILSSVLNVKCDVLFSGNAFRWWVEEGGIIFGESVGLELFAQQIVGRLTYSGCNSGCAVSEEKGGWPSILEVSKEGHETAKATGKYLVHVNCGSLLNCTYNGASLEGIVKGPLLSTQANGEASFQEQTMNKESGVFCPKAAAKLDIVTSPLSVTYISS